MPSQHLFFFQTACVTPHPGPPEIWVEQKTVPDEGHVGMTNEDFCMTDIANGAGLTPPEVVGLRLYTAHGAASSIAMWLLPLLGMQI